MQKRKLVFILGPTASGKSHFALKWAKQCNGVIFNCDSIQVYQGLDIGSAKPTAEERNAVPHFLFDFLPLGSHLTAGEYLRYFSKEMEKVDPAKPIFVVGGTGFYFQALEHGMYNVQPTPVELKKQVLAEINELDGPSKLFQELKQFDPEYAQKIHIEDHYRLARAIEIIRFERKKVSEIMSESKKEVAPIDADIFKIGLRPDKELLRKLINDRCDLMIQKGIIQETILLRESGFAGWAPLKSVGYREVQEYLDQGNSIDWLREWMKIGTWQLAKKQLTWFKRDGKILWLDPAKVEDLAKIEESLVQFLGNSSNIS